MIRFALRQFRVPAIAAAVALVAVGAVVLLTHGHLVDVYDSTVRGCGDRAGCDQSRMAFLDTHHSLGGWLGVLTVAVPGLIGVFWGAPLVAREIEQGTFRLAWTQSVTRSRWLAAQLAVAGLASVVVAGAVSWMVTWWSQLQDSVSDDAFRFFDQRNVVPMGYALVALLLGVTAGVFVRRVMPAIATTVVALIAVRFAVTHWIRPVLLSPRTVTSAIDATRTGYGTEDGGPMSLMPEPPRLPNAWIRSVEIVDGVGRRLTPARVDALCPTLGSDMGPPPSGDGGRTQVREKVVDSLHDCITKVGAKYHVVTTYHPSSRYWAFQWLELGVYVAIAAALIGVCFWGVRRLR